MGKLGELVYAASEAKYPTFLKYSVAGIFAVISKQHNILQFRKKETNWSRIRFLKLVWNLKSDKNYKNDKKYKVSRVKKKHPVYSILR